jgi:hypothetical protein
VWNGSGRPEPVAQRASARRLGAQSWSASPAATRPR